MEDWEWATSESLDGEVEVIRRKNSREYCQIITRMTCDDLIVRQVDSEGKFFVVHAEDFVPGDIEKRGNNLARVHEHVL